MYFFFLTIHLTYYSRDQTDFYTDIIPDFAFHQILYVFKSFLHHSFMLPVPQGFVNHTFRPWYILANKFASLFLNYQYFIFFYWRAYHMRNIVYRGYGNVTLRHSPFVYSYHLLLSGWIDSRIIGSPMNVAFFLRHRDFQMCLRILFQRPFFFKPVFSMLLDL